MDPRKIDVRTVQRYLKKGQVDRAALEKHLVDLPDLSEEAAFVDYEAQFAEEQSKDAEAQVEVAPVIPEPPRPPAPPVHPAHGFPPATAAPLPASPLSATPPSVAAQAPVPAAVPPAPPANPLLSPEDRSKDGGEDR